MKHYVPKVSWHSPRRLAFDFIFIDARRPKRQHQKAHMAECGTSLSLHVQEKEGVCMHECGFVVACVCVCWPSGPTGSRREH